MTVEGKAVTTEPHALQRYVDAGLCALPAIRAEKRPAVGRWKQYQKRLPTPAELSAWMANSPDAVCILCGAASNNAEIIDFDGGGELFSAWWDRIPADLRERLVVERTPSGGWHVIYRCIVAVCGNMKLAQRREGDKIVTLIETRGEGGLFLCAPTPGYKLIQGDLANPPVLTMAERDLLLQAALDLTEYLPPVVDGPMHNGDVGQRAAMSVGPCGSPPEMGARPGDDFNRRGDVRAVLAQHGWVRTKGGENEYWRRPGKESGTSATLKDGVFYVFSSNAAPFEPNRGYSPFAVYSLLNHGGDFEQAARSLGQLGFGSDSLTDNANGADMSGIMRMSVAPGACPSDNAALGQTMATCDGQAAPVPETADPGPLPEHLFRMPGFVGEVMDFTLANAPYPNVGLAFCGALALQSYLCGRRVCAADDLRPNIYLLALAGSGTGKDFPRKVNSRVMFEIGHMNALGDKFASGEGIQDALQRSNAMLFQNDEMDGVLRQINGDHQNRGESIPNILLTLYTSADAVYPIRVRAGQKESAHIDQPHLTLFGTATPQFFYESLSSRMLTNGFFARLIIVDIGKRGRGQTPGPARNLPESIVQVAQWWSDFQPGERKHGSLYDVHPDPRIVPYAPDALDAIEQLQREAENEYDRAEADGDEVSKVALSRTTENAKKLALLYACSENHEDPVIGLPAVEWASAFAMHQTRRQLFLAANYVAENPFHAECLKLVRKLKEAGGEMMRQRLLKAMKCKAADFDQMIVTLVQQDAIQVVDVPTRTRPGLKYVLIG